MNRDNKSLTVAQASRPERYNGKVIKIWQTSFFDHIIRNEKDLHTHLDYIHYNPVKHKLVDKPELWPWSSYRVFLKRGYYEIGWGYSEPKAIKDINYEIKK